MAVYHQKDYHAPDITILKRSRRPTVFFIDAVDEIPLSLPFRASNPWDGSSRNDFPHLYAQEGHSSPYGSYVSLPFLHCNLPPSPATSNNSPLECHDPTEDIFSVQNSTIPRSRSDSYVNKTLCNYCQKQLKKSSL
jgi:hypothetical protein